MVAHALVISKRVRVLAESSVSFYAYQSSFVVIRVVLLQEVRYHVPALIRHKRAVHMS